MRDIEDTNEADPLARLIRAAGHRAEPPEAHRDQVHAAARRAWRNKVASRRRKRWFALAASVALLATSSVLVTRLEFFEPSPAATIALLSGTIEWRSPGTAGWERVPATGMTLPVEAQLRTGEDGRAALNLTEGGSLRVAGNSEIGIGRDRFTLDAGRLYFDSLGRAPSAPITIETRMGTVRDTGTQFELSVDTDFLRIRVREGAIALLGPMATGNAVATGGEELEVSGEAPLTRRRIAPDDPAWAWAGTLATPPTASRSILAYLRWIARETGKRLAFEPESVEVAAEIATFSGDTSGLSPLELLSQIAATSDFDFRLTDDGAILIARN